VTSELPTVEGVEHRFVQAGAVRLHVAEAGAGEPVVLLHSWPQHWYCWRRVIPRLAERHHVICHDDLIALHDVPGGDGVLAGGPADRYQGV
jgi:pimeloyl-ACP methyl ester carboxylesterase